MKNKKQSKGPAAGKPDKKGKVIHEIKEWIKSLAVAFVLFLIIRSFLIQAFKIPTGSMENTLLVGDFLLVNKAVYGATIPFTDYHLPAFSEPQRGDIVVFEFPKDRSLDYVKRCVAVAGDTVEMHQKVLYINGETQEEPYVNKNSRIEPGYYLNTEPSSHVEFPLPRDNFGPIIVPDGHLMVLGDNRDNSSDSRVWGFLDRKLVKGRPEVLYFSWDSENFSPRFSRIGHIIR